HFVHEPSSIAARSELEFVPWGWAPSVATFGAQNGWSCAAPPLEIVREVNSRQFRFQLEEEMDIALPGSSIVTSLDELAGRVAEPSGGSISTKHSTRPPLPPLPKGGSALDIDRASRGWLLKANFGTAGREALRGRGTAIDERTLNWAKKRLARSG